MEDVEISFDFTQLVEKAQLGVIDGLNQAAVEFAVKLADELPPGAAARSIVIRPTRPEGETNYVVSIGIEDKGVLKYIWAYWKGIPQTITIFAHRRFMVFDRWKNGPSDLRWKSDGKFHFPQVQHTYLPHDFVERAIAKFDQLENTILRKIGDRFKNG